MMFATEFPYCHPREIYAYHFKRLWDRRNTSQYARESLRQNIVAQKRHRIKGGG